MHLYHLDQEPSLHHLDLRYIYLHLDLSHFNSLIPHAILDPLWM